MAKLVDKGWYQPKKDESVMVGSAVSSKVPRSFVDKVKPSVDGVKPSVDGVKPSVDKKSK